MSTTANVYVDPDGPGIEIPTFMKLARDHWPELIDVSIRPDDRLAGRVPLIVLSWFEDDPADAGNAS